MAQKKFYKNEIIRKVIVITFLVIGLVILSYIFVLPGYVIHKIENAKFIGVWCGDIMFETDNVDLISDIVQYIDTSTWERKITDKIGIYEMDIENYNECVDYLTDL